MGKIILGCHWDSNAKIRYICHSSLRLNSSMIEMLFCLSISLNIFTFWMEVPVQKPSTFKLEKKKTLKVLYLEFVVINVFLSLNTLLFYTTKKNQQKYKIILVGLYVEWVGDGNWQGGLVPPAEETSWGAVKYTLPWRPWAILLHWPPWTQLCPRGTPVLMTCWQVLSYLIYTMIRS